MESKEKQEKRKNIGEWGWWPRKIENRRREESLRSDETGGERLEWEGERIIAISRPYLLIMSLYFKVQNVHVMLLCDCASGEFPHRSDDKTMPDSSVRGAPTHTLWHILCWTVTKHTEISAIICFNLHTAADRRTWSRITGAARPSPPKRIR